jgi:hypothetical protein
MGRLGSDTKAKYCALWGYAYFADNDIVRDQRTWNDKAGARTAIFHRHWKAGYEWIIWSDSDVILTNPALRLEDLVERHAPEGSDKHVIVARDWGGRQINTGVMWIKTSPEGLAFLQRWELEIEKHSFHDDQLAITELMVEKAAPELGYVAYAQQWEMNSYPHHTLEFEPYNADSIEHHPSHQQWEPGHFLVHVVNCLRRYHEVDTHCCNGIAAAYWREFQTNLDSLLVPQAPTVEEVSRDWTLRFPVETCNAPPLP